MNPYSGVGVRHALLTSRADRLGRGFTNKQKVAPSVK